MAKTYNMTIVFLLLLFTVNTNLIILSDPKDREVKIGFEPNNISIERGNVFRLNITIFMGASNVFAGEFNISYPIGELNLTQINAGSEWKINKIGNKYIYYRNPNFQHIGNRSTLTILVFRHITSSSKSSIILYLTLFKAADRNGQDLSIDVNPAEAKVNIRIPPSSSIPSPGPRVGGRKRNHLWIYLIAIILLAVAIAFFIVTYSGIKLFKKKITCYLIDSSRKIIIPVTGNKIVIGRESFVKWLGRDKLIYITRISRGGHFTIEKYGDQYYIIDNYSTNGTLINGVDIRGKGYIRLRNGDHILIPNVVELIFIFQKY